MAQAFKRTDRIGETIRRNLAKIIQQEVMNPSLPKFITLSAVKVSTDLSHAKIYFTVLDDAPEKTLLALNTVAGHLRMLLAKTLKLRITPQLHFVFDESIEYGKHLSQLIDKVTPPEPDDDANENN